MGGFAAIAAVFILVVLAALGVTLVTISAGQARASAFDALGIQAYRAAHAGIEFGVARALTGNCGSNTLTLPGTTLAPFTVQVNCVSTPHTEVSTTTTIYEITSTACNRGTCPGSADGAYVERQIRVVVGSSAP
jgi:MSHA biogenesis protein MshP